MTYGHDSGFILLNIPNVQIRSRQSSYSQNGTLSVECIYVTPEGQAAIERDVFLILRLNSDEIPLDPRRIVTCSGPVQEKQGRTYVLHQTDLDPEEFELYVALFDSQDSQALQRVEDIDTFEGILTEYADFRELGSANASQSMPTKLDAPQDLRGHLVLMNEDSGEIVGEVDKRISVREEPGLSEKGHEHDPVVIEIGEDEEGQAIEVFARTIPAEQQDWMTKSAKLVSQGISRTTNLLVNVVSSASTFYISHSSPSASSSLTASTYSSTKSSSSSSSSSKAVAFISSSRTQSGLTHAHALTAQAVKVSGKTLSVIDEMIGKIIGNKSGRNMSKGTSNVAPPTSNVANLSPPPPYSTSPIPSTGAKPPLPPRNSSTFYQPGSEKPPLPPRFAPIPPPPLPPRTLTKKAKLILSADLILSTIDESTKQLIDVGGRSATRVVEHRYGLEAARSTALMAGTARNVAVVYIDMQGIGRKALIKRVGKQYIKSRLGK